MTSKQDTFDTTIEQLRKLLPSTAQRIQTNNQHHNETGLEIGTIMISSNKPSALDVIRFFQVVQNNKSKLIIQELHQVNKFDNNNKKVGYCTPLIGLFINLPFEVDSKNNCAYLDGEKFAEKMPYELLDLGNGVQSKIYPMQTFKPMF